MRRRTHKGLRKLCDCPVRQWPKCAHAWHLNYKPRRATPPADWLATPGRDGRPRDPKSWPGYRLSLDAHLGRRLTSKTEAEREATQLKAAMDAGTFGTAAPVRDTLTIGQLLDAYTREVLAHRPGGVRPNDRYQLNSVRRPVVSLVTGESRRFEDWRVEDVSAGTLELLRAALRPVAFVQHGHRRTRIGGPTAANRGLRCLRTIFNWAVRVGYVDATPFKRHGLTTIKLTKEPHRTRRLHDGEGARLLAACGPHLRAVVEAALETGMRRGEVFGLRWADLDLVRGEIRLRPEATKTRTGRTIPISARLRAVLDARRHDPAGAVLPPSAYVFGTATGERVASVKTAWNAACRRAGSVGLHLHDLRREAGSRWLDAGVPLQVVRDWLGHTSVAQTSTYLATTLSTQHAAMRRYDEARDPLQGIATDAGTGGHSGAHGAENVNTKPAFSAGIH